MTSERRQPNEPENWHPVARLDEVWSGEMLSVSVAGRQILLVHTEDTIRAYDDRCAHKGAQLSRGRLDGHVLTCAAHEWQYDVRTGAGLNPQGAKLRPYHVKVEDGIVFIELDDTQEHA